MFFSQLCAAVPFVSDCVCVLLCLLFFLIMLSLHFFLSCILLYNT